MLIASGWLPAMTNPGVQPIVEATAGLESLITGLYEKSGNSGLTREQFAAILNQVAVKYLPAAASASETAELYASLRVEELALARACAAGQERAWEIFMARYREKLYDIAATSPRKVPRRANWQTPCTPISTEPAPATASAFRNWLHTQDADLWKVGCEL